MKHVIKVTSLSNLPNTRPLVAMDNNGNLGWEAAGSGPQPGPTIEMVNLGLPSGTLWAKTNIGAQTETDYGLYFAWGELEQKAGWDGQSDKVAYSWANYRFGGNNKGGQTKYNSTDEKIQLDAEDDIATVIYGENYKIPTEEQFNELWSNTDWWLETDFNGSNINGYMFVNKSDSSKYIFLPFGGTINGLNHYSIGEVTGLWSSVRPGNYTLAKMFKIYDDGSESDIDIEPWDRYYGLSIRPVQSAS